MKEKIFPVSSYVAINDDDGDIVVNTLPPPHQQLPRRESEARSVRKGRLEDRRREEEADNLHHDKNDNQIKKSEGEEDGEEGMAVLPVAGQISSNFNNIIIDTLEIFQTCPSNCPVSHSLSH